MLPHSDLFPVIGWVTASLSRRLAEQGGCLIMLEALAVVAVTVTVMFVLYRWLEPKDLA